MRETEAKEPYRGKDKMGSRANEGRLRDIRQEPQKILKWRTPSSTEPKGPKPSPEEGLRQEP